MLDIGKDQQHAYDDGYAELNITKNEAYAIANHIDTTLIQSIRDDTEIDSLMWLRNMIHGYEKLCEYSGYCGSTESDPEKTTGAVIYD